MEVRKASVQQIIQPEIPQKSEVSKTKNAGQNLIPDTFEKENSKSSSSSSTSTASSEPEKKAGQITGGILIKQMTAARMGETNPNSQQSSESSGKKELTPEQQSRVSNFDPRKENLKPSFFLQDARSRDEDRKNSGLQVPFAPAKAPESEQQAKLNQSRELAKDLIGKDTTVHDGSEKDFSNDPLISGKGPRDAVKDETDNRQKDADALGGRTGTDRLTNVADPTSSSPQQSGPTHNQSMIASDLAEQCIKEGLITREEYEKAKAQHADKPANSQPTTPEEPKAPGQSEKPKVSDIIVNIVTSLPGVFLPRGIVTPPVPPDPETGKNVMRGIKAIGESKDRTPESETLKGTTDGGAKSYTQENYTGNIPEEVKKVKDYFLQQVRAQKPQSGGETVHTDDSATGGTITGGPVSNRLVQQGSLGLLGNPGSADLQTGFSGGQGPVTSSQSGGNVDYGPDSDKVGYDGPTHQDNPGDVQFGPETPVAEGSVEPKNTDDDASNDFNILIDLINRKRKQAQGN
jgi:hypothetical protein